MISYSRATLIIIVFAVKIQDSLQCPQADSHYLKSMYKSGELRDQDMPITIQNLKDKLKQSGIFDYEDKSLTEREKKEMAKLFNVIELMTTSRSRQPSNVQTIFSSMRLLERAVKKQLKENQLSESLASKFHWEKLANDHTMKDS